MLRFFSVNLSHFTFRHQKIELFWMVLHILKKLPEKLLVKKHLALKLNILAKN